MKHSRSAIICFFILIIFIFSSCSKPDVIDAEKITLEYDDVSDTTITDPTIYTQYEPSYTDGIQDIMKSYAKIDLSPGKSLFGYTYSVYLDGELFIMPTFSQMLRYNYAGNTWDTYCIDPLCKHNSSSCIDNCLGISAITTDGETLFIKGIDFKGSPVSFVGCYDTKSSSYEIFDILPAFQGSDSLSFIYHKGCLYYTKKESEECNNIWKYNIKEQVATQITEQEKIIVQFQISDSLIYYRDNTYNCYLYNIIDDKTNFLLDRVSTVGEYNNMVFYIRMFSDDGVGFDLYSAPAGSPKSMEKMISSIYSPMSVSFIDNKIYYTVWNEISNGFIEIDNRSYEDVTFNGYDIRYYDIDTKTETCVKFSPKNTCGVNHFFGIWGDKMLISTRSVLSRLCYYLVDNTGYIRVN